MKVLFSFKNNFVHSSAIKQECDNNETLDTLPFIAISRRHLYYLHISFQSSPCVCSVFAYQ